MKKISRKLYHENISDVDAVKALALLIFIKNSFPTSVVPNYSVNKLVRVTGMHANTIRKRISTLADMDLIEFTGKYNQHLKFKKVRAKNSNIKLSINTSSVKLIEKGLRALFLVEKVTQKNYVEQRVKLANAPKNIKELKAGRRASKKCGSSNFKDNGISYAYLADKLGVSIKHAVEVVQYAINLKLIVKHKVISQVVYIEDRANEFVRVFSELKGVFAKKNSVYKVEANRYSLYYAN